MKKIIFLMLILVLLTSCKKEETSLKSLAKLSPTNENHAQSNFELQCSKDNNEWMLMIPLKDGAETSDKPCTGCMADEKNHICDFEDYKKFMGE